MMTENRPSVGVQSTTRLLLWDHWERIACIVFPMQGNVFVKGDSLTDAITSACNSTGYLFSRVEGRGVLNIDFAEERQLTIAQVLSGSDY